MPTITVTLPTMNAPPKAVHAGVNALIFQQTQARSGTTDFGTAGDVMLLGKIPNGAILLSMDGRAATHSVGITLNYTLRLQYTEGSGSSTVVTISPVIACADGTSRMSLLGPVKVNISEDQALQYATLQLFVNTGATATDSFSCGGVLYYLMDGQVI